MSAKQDLRVIKTKNTIKNAFVMLINKKSFYAITIQNILDVALINRKTFYNYYKDKYDLAEQIATELVKDFAALVTNIKGFKYSGQLEELYKKLYEQKAVILGLWEIRTENINIYDHMQRILQQKYMGEVQEKNLNPQLQSFLFSTLILNAFKYMLESDESITVQDLLKEMRLFLMAALKNQE